MVKTKSPSQRVTGCNDNQPRLLQTVKNNHASVHILDSGSLRESSDRREAVMGKGIVIVPQGEVIGAFRQQMSNVRQPESGIHFGRGEIERVGHGQIFTLFEENFKRLQ